MAAQRSRSRSAWLWLGTPHRGMAGSALCFCVLFNAAATAVFEEARFVRDEEGSMTGQEETAQAMESDCYRDCLAGNTRTCKYYFYEEIYNALNTACGNCSKGQLDDCFNEECVFLDGIERPVYAINRKVPGPTIHACAGDTIEVELVVALPGHGDTIHWHGLTQRNSPYMDGVSGVTQCPVNAGQRFRYRFTAERPGTFFYHTHNGIHKVNGGVGGMVFRGPQKDDPNGDLYDEDLRDHEVFLMDWMHSDAEYVFPGLQSPSGQNPACILINGKGNFQLEDGTYTLTPLEEFVVERGKRYRFRVTNSGWASCPIGLRFLEHQLTVIASDANDVQPQLVDTLYSGSGERYDLVLTANQPRDAYWVHAFTAGFCEGAGTQVDQVAVLRYSDAAEGAIPTDLRPSISDMNSLGTTINSATCTQTDSSLCATSLKNKNKPAAELLVPEPDVTLVIAIGFHTFATDELFLRSPTYPKFLTVGSANMAGTLNNISYQQPPSSLLTQPGVSPTCDSCGNSTFCQCTHVIKVPLGKIVDIIFVEQTNVTPDDQNLLAHPMHLHGYSYLVRGVGSLRNISSGAERVQYVKDNAPNLVTNDDLPPAKDTVILQGGGYASIRFHADNPGMWFLHCHFQYHMASGMEGVIQVGEYIDFMPAPENFPACVNFLPNN